MSLGYIALIFINFINLLGKENSFGGSDRVHIKPQSSQPWDENKINLHFQSDSFNSEAAHMWEDIARQFLNLRGLKVGQSKFLCSSKVFVCRILPAIFGREINGGNSYWAHIVNLNNVFAYLREIPLIRANKENALGLASFYNGHQDPTNTFTILRSPQNPEELYVTLKRRSTNFEALLLSYMKLFRPHIFRLKNCEMLKTVTIIMLEAKSYFDSNLSYLKRLH